MLKRGADEFTIEPCTTRERELVPRSNFGFLTIKEGRKKYRLIQKHTLALLIIRPISQRRRNSLNQTRLLKKTRNKSFATRDEPLLDPRFGLGIGPECL